MLKLRLSCTGCHTQSIRRIYAGNDAQTLKAGFRSSEACYSLHSSFTTTICNNQLLMDETSRSLTLANHCMKYSDVGRCRYLCKVSWSAYSASKTTMTLLLSNRVGLSHLIVAQCCVPIPRLEVHLISVRRKIA